MRKNSSRPSLRLRKAGASNGIQVANWGYLIIFYKGFFNFKFLCRETRKGKKSQQVFSPTNPAVCNSLSPISDGVQSMTWDSAGPTNLSTRGYHWTSTSTKLLQPTRNRVVDRPSKRMVICGSLAQY